MLCRYLRKRQYNLRPYFFCANKKKPIKYNACYNCKKFEVRDYKPIKKVSKKREVVSDATYNKVVLDCHSKCKICDTYYDLELHHIIYRSEDKTKINDVNNCIMLCNSCHRLVHSNKNLWQPILKLIRNEVRYEKGYKFKRTNKII